MMLGNSRWHEMHTVRTTGEINQTQESMDRCTDRSYITTRTLKTALNTVKSISSVFAPAKGVTVNLTLSPVINFRLIQTERLCRRQFQISITIAESSPNGYKTLWKKDESLVTSNFSFSHSVFKRLVLQTHKNQGLFGKELSHNGIDSDKIAKMVQFNGSYLNDFM